LLFCFDFESLAGGVFCDELGVSFLAPLFLFSCFGSTMAFFPY